MQRQPDISLAKELDWSPKVNLDWLIKTIAFSNPFDLKRKILLMLKKKEIMKKKY
jgi:hypothetical protein